MFWIKEYKYIIFIIYILENLERIILICESIIEGSLVYFLNMFFYCYWGRI